MLDRRTSRPISKDQEPTIEETARLIVLDGFQTKKKWPQNLVETDLPVPMAKGSRKRVSRQLGVAMTSSFHSLYDKAIHHIRQETP